MAPIRSSDRRKIADSIISEYQIEVPHIEAVEEDGADKEQSSAVSGLGALRSALLPEGSMSARVTTTHGPDQTPVSGTIYVGSYPNQEVRVLWLKLEDRIYPTGQFNRASEFCRSLLVVYTLWQHPNLVPLLHTTDNVVLKMQGGSDLMTPGLAGPPFPVKAKKGSTVAVANLSRPSVPIVVGVCEVDVASLQSVQGIKGHAVRGVHWSGDELWSWNVSGGNGRSPPEHIPGWQNERQDEDTTNQLKDLDIGDKDEDEGGVLLEQSSSRQPPNNFVQGEDPPLPSTAETAEDSLTVKGLY